MRIARINRHRHEIEAALFIKTNELAVQVLIENFTPGSRLTPDFQVAAAVGAVAALDPGIAKLLRIDQQSAGVAVSY